MYSAVLVLHHQLHLPTPVGRGESRLVCRVVVQVGKGGVGGQAEGGCDGVQSAPSS
jgi:hypothetical protein